MAPDCSPVVISAENIAFLYLLHSVPTPPSSNSPASLPLSSTTYNLSFETERNLASALAFLARLKDGPDHIPAICIQECPNAATSKLLITVNKNSWDGGDGVLETLKDGFENVLRPLMLEGDKIHTLNAVFSAVIKMCATRILCRLRLAPSHRKKTKLSISAVLQNSIDSLKKVHGSLPAMIEQYVEQARNLIQKLKMWIGHPTNENLGDVVVRFHDISRVPHLSHFINAIPDKYMDPSSRKSLVNVISKVGRYRSVARLLCRSAAKNPILRQMDVVLATLPKDYFHVDSIVPNKPDLTAVMTRATDHNSRCYQLDQICRPLGIPHEEANRQFAERAEKILEKSKIHAEIQLVFYIQLHQLHPSPRIICSSKDACFLCNMFISLHGKHHIPRCHGRLYSGWRLPHSQSSEQVQFNNRLQEEIQKSLSTLMSRRVKTVYPDPNESTLLTIRQSNSTLLGGSEAESEVQRVIESLPGSISRSSRTTLPRNFSREEIQEVSHSSVAICSIDSAVSEREKTRSPIPPLPGEEKRFVGHQDGRTPTVIGVVNWRIFEISDILQIYIEYPEADKETVEPIRPKFACTVELLSSKDETHGEKPCILDCDLLHGEIILGRNEVSNLHLLVGNSVVRLSITSDDEKS